MPMDGGDPLSLAGSASWTTRFKPPNYPNMPTRRGSATLDSSAANYNTFRTTNGDPVVGLSTRVARRRLLDAVERKVEEKERSTDFTKEFRDPFSLLLLVCAIFRFVDYTRQNAVVATPLFEGLFLVGAAVLNVVMNRLQRRRHHDEMAERVRMAVKNMLTTEHEPESYTYSATLRPTKSAVLLPSTSLIACYRDSQWQRLTMNLLVDGDVIALMSGDVAPGDVRALTDPPATESMAAVFPRGATIPSSSEPLETTRCNATFNPSLLLSLCGDMRVFVMLETPVIQDIDDAFFRINRPQTYTQKLQAKARLIAVYVCTLYSVCILLAIGLRVVFQHRSLFTTLNHILLGPIGIWLCFASLNTPLVLFLAESVATASVLGSFETILANKPTKSSHERRSSTEIEQTPLMRPRDADSHHASDLYDSEDREKLRSVKASRQSAFRRSLEYFFVVLRFRAMNCEQAHHNGRRNLPVPFRSFRLLERLGSTTMLCCFDDDVLCEQASSVEEIFLLNDKQGNSTVLDLHPDHECETGLKFEDPKWRQHLPSLKPIGLAILLNDAENPAEYYHSSMGYLMNEMYVSSDSDGGGATLPNSSSSATTTKDPYVRACIQRLSAHVRMLPFPKHLLNLSEEMGFVREDLASFRRLQGLHIICPRLAQHEHAIDHHDQGPEDTRYQGNLKTHLYSTIVADQRSNRLQLLARGHPTMTLSQCSEYWDGKSICPLTHDKRRAILDMYNQWRVEDLDCVALSYVPVPPKLSAMFTRSNNEQALREGELLAPVYLVEDSAAGDNNLQETSVHSGGGGGTSAIDEDSSVTRSRGRSQPNPAFSPLASPRSNDDRRSTGMTGTASSTGQTSGVPVARPISPVSRHRSGGVGGMVSLSDAASSVGMQASEMGSSERDALLWQIQDDQIFLGMVATGVQPKRAIPDVIEDLTASGIRFVYFSPRNMRRSKLLAEKMGIETDWNCAISLRPLESDGPDPHRMTSNYSDWDVKARLPHGIPAIIRHIEEVDNVPLLVSLFTDSTADTIGSMISIFQENDEVVLGVGSSLRASNAALFSKADVAVALQTGHPTLFDEPLPHGKDLSMLTEDDLELSQILNTLTCSFSVDGADSSAAGLTQLIELIRLGRCVLANFHQMMAFIFVSQLFLATIILVSYLAPFPFVPQLSCSSIFWVLWVLVPALSLPMLASPEEKDVMKRTPRKNEEVVLHESLPRLATYFICRHIPAVFLAIFVFESALGLSLSANRDKLPDKYNTHTWVDFMFSSSLLLQRPRPPVLTAAIDRAEGAMSLMIGLALISASTSYLYRFESVFFASPLRNRMWMGVAATLLLIQIAVSTLRAGLVGADGLSLGTFVTQVVPWHGWVVVCSWPSVSLLLDELVKKSDRHYLKRYYKFLRMQFDTRLGMWSPK
ncbi:hypothetical protein Poli38472_014552 [Pythium oligandrum]|uniref:Cation-transporting P-type ATPase C-terminal domain-containing protein n=1 Tax=Pythium oligandrum TaxID=41045 RepID=A0A8K1CDX3_PYTOL|nr:hypothetical protein Poli38472_014552 [Pythium oligandrum]|eukprot:TMW61091.1 hypothetical protein Poli38472_014552 [Pythium oligandrum]